MPRPKKTNAPAVKKPAAEIRLEIKEFIKNRDSIGQKWKCLEESVHSEDVRRQQFYNRKVKDNTRELPVTIQKFIRTLKRAVHNTMRHVGGTPFSIVRQMFLHWDTRKGGALSEEDLDKCMRSLGVQLSSSDRRCIVDFYSAGTGQREMTYQDLLEDIQRGEPGMLDVVEDTGEDEEDVKLRFRTREDDFAVMPPLVSEFIEAIRNVLSKKLRNEGGTPYSHLRNAFLRYDSQYANALSAEDLRRAMVMCLGITVSPSHCAEIVKHYDRKGLNTLDYKLLLADVCKDMPNFIAHRELTHEDVQQSRMQVQKNMFLPKPFKAKSNRVLEQFKRDVKATLHIKVCNCGGSTKSWLKEAFIAWDQMMTGKISRPEVLQGAMKRIGVTLSVDDAKTLMSLYDRDGDGAMDYHLVIADLLDGEPAFAAAEVRAKSASTARAPDSVNGTLRRIQKAASLYQRKSKGHLEAKDLLMGTFLRFDGGGTGRVSSNDVAQVMRILQVKGVSDSDLAALVTWFDSNGSGQLDYQELIKQVCGSFDEMLNRRTLAASTSALPPINSPSKPKPVTRGQIVLTDDPHDHRLGNAKDDAAKAHNAALAAAIAAEPAKTDSKLVKEARRALRTKQIMAEKIKLETKIAQIERAKKAIVESYRIAHGQV